MASANGFNYNDSFKPAKSRKKRKGQVKNASRSPVDLYESASKRLLDEDGGEWLKKFEGAPDSGSTRHHLTDSIAQLLEILGGFNPPEHVVCLGLGSPTESVNSRVQLAALIRLVDVLSLASLLHAG